MFDGVLDLRVGNTQAVADRSLLCGGECRHGKSSTTRQEVSSQIGPAREGLLGRRLLLSVLRLSLNSISILSVPEALSSLFGRFPEGACRGISPSSLIESLQPKPDCPVTQQEARPESVVDTILTPCRVPWSISPSTSGVTLMHTETDVEPECTVVFGGGRLCEDDRTDNRRIEVIFDACYYTRTGYHSDMDGVETLGYRVVPEDECTAEDYLVWRPHQSKKPVFALIPGSTSRPNHIGLKVSRRCFNGTFTTT